MLKADRSFFASRSLLRLRASVVAATALALFSSLVLSHAATPASGSLSASSTAPVTWMGDAPGTGAANGESTCVDGVNCDVFTLTLSGNPTDYAGKQLSVAISWTVPADDYDLYVHKDTVSGPVVASSAGGAPSTMEQVAISPATSGTGKYVVHVVYFTTSPADQYQGTAKITAASVGPRRTAKYITGAAAGISFSRNTALKAPAEIRDGEPASRTDSKGNFYISGIRGFPAGVDLWYTDLRPDSPTYDPTMRVPAYRGQPDAFSPDTTVGDLGGDGGGDVDLAVGHGLVAGQAAPTLAFSSLIAANISTGLSIDRAQSYTRNPAGNVTGGIPADDRQWEEFLGSTSVYLLYRTLEPAVSLIQRSDDGGLTFGAASTAGQIGQVGELDVHQKDGVVYAWGGNGVVAVGTPSVAGMAPLSTDYVVTQAASDPNGVAHIFFTGKVADDGTKDGTVYSCYSNDHDIFLVSSTDKGAHWSAPVRVNDGVTTKTNVLPWMETGPTPGSVGVVWYGTTDAANDDKAEWKVYFAQSFDASSTKPTFRIAEVTEPQHYIHASNISEGGLTGTANRNLLDYFQVSFDPTGAAVVGYTDDHNDFDGATYIARQVTGPSINSGSMLPPVNEGNKLTLPPGTATVTAQDAFPPRQPGYNGEQVTDFVQDVTSGAVTRLHVNSPVDITTVRYDTSGTGKSLALAATIRVSDLSTVAPNSTYRAVFAVNSPHSVLSDDGTYTYGTSDHGDQFYLQAVTDASGAATYTYGTVVRNSDGSLTYTSVGNADTGNIDSPVNTISIQIAVSKLNAALPKGHKAIANGTVVTGLRASASAASGDAQSDDTRGGTQFVVHDSSQPFAEAAPLPTPLPAAAPGASPSPTPPRSMLGNISTRLQVLTGEKQGIAGIIVRGAASKRVLIRGIGPSLPSNLATPTISDPVLNVFDSTQTNVASNDNWRSTQEAEITATGIAPTKNAESAVIVNLAGNSSYTAVLSSKSGQGGLGLIEAYDLDAGVDADLGNISTRGEVGTGDNVLIGGFIVRRTDTAAPQQKIVVRALGPSLTALGVTDALQDPTLSLYDGNGTVIESNDNFAQSAEKAQITAEKLAPKNPREAAIQQVLAPGAYTAIVRGAAETTGVGLVEVYNLGTP